MKVNCEIGGGVTGGKHFPPENLNGARKVLNDVGKSSALLESPQLRWKDPDRDKRLAVLERDFTRTG